MQTDVQHELEPRQDLFQHRLGDGRFGLGQVESREEVVRLVDGERGRLHDVLAADEDVQRLFPQTDSIARFARIVGEQEFRAEAVACGARAVRGIE